MIPLVVSTPSPVSRSPAGVYFCSCPARAVRLVVVALLVVFLPAVHAVRTESVVHQSYADFSAGELENLSLHRDGRLRLAPVATEIGQLAEAVIWSAATSPDGSVFIGAGNDGAVFRLSPEGELEKVFSTEEVITRAMAVDLEGRLYVGTSPDGKVYRYTEEGELEVFFNPHETYIWALLFNEEGDIFVGTGEEGRIYRIEAGAEAGTEGEVYFDADESHISILAWDQKGRLLAGSSPNGYVYRIEGPEKVSVLFNSPDEEIRHMLPGDDGEIYVTTFSSTAGQAVGTAVVQAIAAMTEVDKENGENGTPATPPARRTAATSATSGRPSTLYRVDEDGFHEPFWGLAQVAIHSVLKLKGGPLLIGTGDAGQIFSQAGFQSWKLRQTLPSASKVSELLQVPGSSDVLAFSSNPARIYRLDFGMSGSGEYLSSVFDAGQVASWGRIYTESGGGTGNGLETFVRTGNTEKADRTWTRWRAVDLQGNGSGETVPGRYFQYRLNFTEPDVEARRVRFFYRHANAAPVIQSLRVLTTNLGLERYEMPPQQPPIDLDQLARGTRPRSAQSGEARQQVRGYERPGTVTVVWQSRDANDDELVFTLKLRRAGAEAWDIIADDVRHPFHSFNGNGLPDGEYQVKLVASDRLSNQPSEFRESRRISENFLIDNAAPEIHVEEVVINGNNVKVRFRAVDATSVLTRAAYVLNGEVPVVLYPEDGIFDGREERFQIDLQKLAPGRHTLLLEVADEIGNPRIQKVAVEVKGET